MNYIITSKAAIEINTFYYNVCLKYKYSYSIDLMLKNLNDAYDAIYQIENGLLRRKPTITRWDGLHMASYMVDGKTRWNFVYRIENDTIYVEDACHAQNMSEFTNSQNSQGKISYRKLRTKPLFGYSFVMNDKKEYNLADDNGKLLTHWFKSIKPINKPEPYGKYQIIAYINVGGYFCALGYDGKVYNINKTWKEMCAENRRLLNTSIFISIITEQIEKNMKHRITLTESKLNQVVENAVKEMLNEMQMDRDYRDLEGNKIKGKQALIQHGSYKYPKYNNSLAVANQASYTYKVLDNFLKTVSHWSDEKSLWEDELYRTGRTFQNLLQRCIDRTPDYISEF